MLKGEILVASRLLARASDEFSNHGCNDMAQSMFLDVSDEEKLQMEQAYNTSNSEDPDDYVKFEYIQDWAWMQYLSDKLNHLSQK
jgi:hypothetical protein